MYPKLNHTPSEISQDFCLTLLYFSTVSCWVNLHTAGFCFPLYFNFHIFFVILCFVDFFSGTIFLKNSDQTLFSLQPLRARLLIFTQIEGDDNDICNENYNDQIKYGTRYDFHMSFSIQSN